MDNQQRLKSAKRRVRAFIAVWGSVGLVLAVLVLAAAGEKPKESEKYRKARLEMVNTVVVPEGITNKLVVEALRQVPRHLFVPPNLVAQAYFDRALPIGQKQTISPPFIVAYMTQSLDPQPTDRVLEIGTGSGYQAAILSRIVKEVYSIEIVETLGLQAAKRLEGLGYDNITTRVGDGFKGWPEKAPFDKIIVTCSPESVPDPLIEQLREGGKLIVPLGERYQQVFYLFEKQNGELVKTKLLPTLFVPMTGISEEQRQVKPDPAHPAIRNGGFEAESVRPGHPDAWHYQRQLTLMHGDAPEGDAYITLTNEDPGRHAQALQGMALDGKQVRAVQISLMLKGSKLQVGKERNEHPACSLYFFDSNRKPIGEEHLGPWVGTFDWKTVTGELNVPPAAREAIVQIGLYGATGSLSVDQIQLTPGKRR